MGQTPAESTLAMALEYGEFSRYIGENLCLYIGGGDWPDLSNADRTLWVESAIDILRDQINRSPPTDEGERRAA